jgi:hypothetical protein
MQFSSTGNSVNLFYRNPIKSDLIEVKIMFSTHIYQFMRYGHPASSRLQVNLMHVVGFDVLITVVIKPSIFYIVPFSSLYPRG